MRVLQTIEEGYKSWETLSPTLDSAAWNFARDLVPPPKVKQQSQSQNFKTQNSSQNICSTFNTFKKDGCAFENSNPGESCIFVHQCSTCAKRGFPNRKHKAFNCRDEAKFKSNSSNTPPVPGAAPATHVTSV